MADEESGLSLCGCGLHALGIFTRFLEGIAKRSGAGDFGPPDGLVIGVCAAGFGLETALDLAQTGSAQPAHFDHIFGNRRHPFFELVHLHLGGECRLHRGDEPGLFHQSVG